jgi:cell division protease FtsH
MVTKWGLSEKMGPLLYDEGGEEVFLGRSASQQHKAISDETAKQIDAEVRRIIDECYEKARRFSRTTSTSCT